MTMTLTAADQRRLHEMLHDANHAFMVANPGDSTDRQPVHVVYGGAHLFKAGTAARLGALALASLDKLFPDADSFGQALGLGEHAATIRQRVVEKLTREPVEDLRIDFEDGYGPRPDAEEDADARRVASEVMQGLATRSLPWRYGIRIKPLTQELASRGLKTLDLFVSELARLREGNVPPLIVTLPKVTVAAQVQALAEACQALERTLGLADYTLKLELMVETPQVIVDEQGRCPLRSLVAAAKGRCVGAHFGTYDYTAACGITAGRQTHDHPAADHARTVMQAALAGTGVQLSDGATNVLPLPLHRGEVTDEWKRGENLTAMRDAVRLHFDNVSRSLRHGFYQGWDLHPAQLPARFAATYAFFLSELESTTVRLSRFLSLAAQASSVGTTFDDAATGQGLLNFFLRGLACGALSERDVLAAGLSLDELKTRSFQAIVAGRRARA